MFTSFTNAKQKLEKAILLAHLIFKTTQNQPNETNIFSNWRDSKGKIGGAFQKGFLRFFTYIIAFLGSP